MENFIVSARKYRPDTFQTVVGLMVDQLGWLATLASGSTFALTGAALWLLIRIRPAATANATS
jgi:hypothetical protein